MQTIKPPQVVAIIGPTASGKTELGIKLSQEFSGEIISADSRQVYKFLDVGTDKPAGAWQWGPGGRAYLVGGVPHYLIDILDPRAVMSAALFKTEALARSREISSRHKLPIVVGGTGLYVQALLDNWQLPPVPPNLDWRRQLSNKPLAVLQAELRILDQEAARNIDLENPRRVERALEVALAKGAPFKAPRQGPPLVEALRLGLRWNPGELRERLKARLTAQLARGFLEETKRLFAAGYSLGLPSLSGIGYRELASYLAGECTLAEAVRKIETATWRYARRQMTWFKRDRAIKWIPGDDYAAARQLVEEFLTTEN